MFGLNVLLKLIKCEFKMVVLVDLEWVRLIWVV